jgi:hypothetical protein
MNPLAWRDRLPMEIAILERLKTQDHANIHKYHGYRLDMRRLRWRLYHDYCDYGSLGLALSYNVNFDEPQVARRSCGMCSAA